MYVVDLLLSAPLCSSFLFFFNDPATTEIYTLSLHDALPISDRARLRGAIWRGRRSAPRYRASFSGSRCSTDSKRSEEHTSELQSHHDLVCRLLLEKKKKKKKTRHTNINKIKHNTQVTYMKKK